MSRSTTKRATRDALAEAAVRLVREQGYAATTVEQIASEAGVAERTFFRHFPSKEAALFSREEQFLAELQEQLARVDDELPILAAARVALIETAKFIESQGDWLLEFAAMALEVPAVDDHVQHGVGRLMRAELVAWAARRSGRPANIDPLPIVLAGAAGSCAEAGMRSWIAHHGSTDLPGTIARAFDELKQAAADL